MDEKEHAGVCDRWDQGVGRMSWTAWECTRGVCGLGRVQRKHRSGRASWDMQGVSHGSEKVLGLYKKRHMDWRRCTGVPSSFPSFLSSLSLPFFFFPSRQVSGCCWVEEGAKECISSQETVMEY